MWENLLCNPIQGLAVLGGLPVLHYDLTRNLSALNFNFQTRYPSFKLFLQCRRHV
jgi:hypothetical protein